MPNSVLFFKSVPEGTFIFADPQENPWIFGACDHYLVSMSSTETSIAAILLPQRSGHAPSRGFSPSALSSLTVSASIFAIIYFASDHLSAIGNLWLAIATAAAMILLSFGIYSHCRTPQPAPPGTDPCRRAAYRSADNQRRNPRRCQKQDVAQAILAHRRCLRIHKPPCARGPRIRRQSEACTLQRCPVDRADDPNGPVRHAGCDQFPRRAEEKRPARAPIARQAVHPRKAAPTGRAGLGACSAGASGHHRIGRRPA